MKTRFLFSHRWRKGAIILIFLGLILASVLICFYNQFTVWQTERSNSGLKDFEGIVESVVLLLLICGLLLFAFTKEEVEDEHLVQLRLDSLQWAVYSNYGLVVISILILNGSDLITVLGANVFTPLVIFILRFRWAVYNNAKLSNEASA